MRWPTIQSFHHADFEPRKLAELKAGTRERVSVCIPARDEGTTIGAIVRTIRDELLERVGLVDEILVVDDGSTDDTVAVAEAAGARVVAACDVLPGVGPGGGKGEALWKSVAEAEGDVIAWVDGDIIDFGPHFVAGLVGPLLTRPGLSFVKGFYERPSPEGRGGGRVTELVARPLLAMLFPHLGPIVQPLAGEYAGRRAILEQVPFVQGYGVDIGLLVDVAELAGIEAIAQVDLATRRHRNRPLAELGLQAVEVMQAALRRAGTGVGDRPVTLVRPGLEPVEIGVRERPPLVDVAEYRRRSA